MKYFKKISNYQAIMNARKGGREGQDVHPDLLVTVAFVVCPTVIKFSSIVAKTSVTFMTDPAFTTFMQHFRVFFPTFALMVTVPFFFR